MDMIEKTMREALGSLENGKTFKRSQLHEYLVATGYSERTATNHMMPSRKGGIICELLASGAIVPHGPKGYRIENPTLIKKAKKKTAIVRMFTGEPREGWKPMGVMSDSDAHEVEWKLCGQMVTKGVWSLKLYADGSVPNKANFWMQYREGRGLIGRDAEILKSHHPDIYENTLTDMVNDFSC